jgi:hypothetical protein
MLKTINVTEEDIKPYSCIITLSCAIERAVRRELPGLSGYTVNYKGSFAAGCLRLFTKLGHCQEINLPKEAVDLMKGYDGCFYHKKYLKPISFTIELDERIKDQLKTA